MKIENINIVLATDDNYVQHCAITIASILKRNNNVTIYILTEDLSERNKGILKDEADFFNAHLYFVQINKNLIDSLPMPSHTYLSHISRATYYRLVLPDIISTEIDKVIYLDCDLIVNTSLQNLWQIDLDNYAIAACRQIGGLRDAGRLGIPLDFGYFNAGVLVINLKYWRENNISYRLIDYLFKNTDRIIFHDQDALNAVLYDKCVHLHQQWNMNYATYSSEFLKNTDDYSQEIEEALLFQKTPSILHYSARVKPWDWRCTHPLIDMYYENAKYTQHFNHINTPSTILKFMAKFREDFIRLLVKIKQITQ